MAGFSSVLVCSWRGSSLSISTFFSLLRFPSVPRKTMRMLPCRIPRNTLSKVQNFIPFCIRGWLHSPIRRLVLGNSRMANGDEKGEDLYAVLGLKEECTAPELRNAYKKLTLVSTATPFRDWHLDRCSVSGTPEFAEEAKKKFQDIQQAYSVLSDVIKRFLYYIGANDNDDDENVSF